MSLVRNGKGIVFGPESFADYYHVAAVPLVPEEMVSLSFICLKSSLGRKEIQILRDDILAKCYLRGLLVPSYQVV